MTTRSMRALLAGLLLGSVLLPFLPAAPAQAESRAPSTFTGVSANDYTPGSCSGRCSTPSAPMRCDNPDGEGPQVAAQSNSRYYTVWANPTKRTSQTGADSFTLSASFAWWSSSGTYTIPMQSADSLVSHDDGWQFKPWTKRRGIFPETGPDAINEGNFTTTGTKYDGTLTVQVAQTIGVAGAASLGAVFCEQYHYYQPPDYSCPVEPTIDPVTKKVIKPGDPNKMCTPPRQRIHDAWDKVSEWKSSGVVYTNVHENQSWAGSGAGLCMREYHGDLTGPFQVDWSKNASKETGFLDNIQFNRGDEYLLADNWDDAGSFGAANVKSINLKQYPRQSLSAYTASDGKMWVKSLYGMAPGMDDRGWRNCIGLHVMTGDWETPVHALGRYTGRITWKSDWVSIVDVPNTRPNYRQKWDWLNDQVSANSINRWVTKQGDKEAQALGWPAGAKWGGYILMQVGRDHPTLRHPAGEAGASGVFITSRDEGLYYAKSCRNAAPAGYATVDHANNPALPYGSSSYQTAVMDYVAPNPAAPLDRNSADWGSVDGGNPAVYYENNCGDPSTPPGSPEKSSMAPAFPDLSLQCVNSKDNPVFGTWNSSTGSVGDVKSAAGNIADVRADGKTTAVDWAPNGPVYVRTDGGTEIPDSTAWQMRVDVPDAVGLNSPSLSTKPFGSSVNDPSQPYTPVYWPDIATQNTSASATWWNLNTWHTIPTLTKDDSFTTYQTIKQSLYTPPQQWYQPPPIYYPASSYPVQVWDAGGGGNITAPPDGNCPAGWSLQSGNGHWRCIRGGYITVWVSSPARTEQPPGYFVQPASYMVNDPVPTGCVESGNTWSCLTTVIHQAASIPGLGMRFFDSAVDKRHFQMTATWKRTMEVSTLTNSAQSWGALTGSTMDGDIGWAADPGYSVAAPAAVKLNQVVMQCISKPAGLQAERVANVASTLQR